MAHRQYYTTLETVLSYLDNGTEQGSLAPSAANEYAYIWQQIALASSMVEQYVGRSFIPYYGDVTVTDADLWDSTTVAVSAGIIALETVDGGSIASYAVLPRNSTLGHFLRSTVDGGWNFIDYDDSAVLTGWFGYHPTYASAWLDVETVTTDDSQTVIEVADANAYETGWTLRIESELMLVTARDTDADEITVERGINGTTKAAHTTQTVQRYVLPDPVIQVTTEVVTWLYKNRHKLNEVFAVPGGTVRVGGFDPAIYKPLDRYRLECSRIQPYG